MYFLVLLFIIVVLKLYITHVNKIKERFVFRDLLDEQTENEQERSPEYQNIINNYIERIKQKFKDLQDKRKAISSIKEEIDDNEEQGMNSLNKNSYNRRLLNQ